MARKPDIVALKWVVGLINEQAEKAETSLVEYSRHPAEKEPLLHCMWAIHQITSTLRALGLKKGEMLTIEMERALNYIYKEKVAGERLKLTMGGIMQAIKVLPAYLAHTQNSRQDTGQGLEQHVNDLRRWLGERPRPPAFFFYMEVPETAGITDGASPADDEEVKDRANVMLALYLEMAKMALRGRNVTEGMRTVARVARKMKVLFAGTQVERFWLAMVGLCEGIAGGLIIADECIAQIFKAGAFMIKYARENGSKIDPSVDYDDYLQQMLFYIAACKSKPVHIAQIRRAFAIDDSTLETASRGLVHIDALITALTGAMEQLDVAVEFLSTNDPHEAGDSEGQTQDATALDGIDAASCRLEAAGELGHADTLQRVHTKLGELYQGLHHDSTVQHEQVVGDVISGIVEVKIDIEHKLKHGLSNAFSSRDYELRESVVTASFTHMSQVENYLHQLLRRKALASAVATRESGEDGLAELAISLKRYLNKSDQGHEELRQAVKDADEGNANADLLYEMASGYLDGLSDMPEREAIELSLKLINQISGALSFAGMDRESQVIEQCHRWLTAVGKAGNVAEDEAFRCFADVFAQLELHLQRILIDPLDDTSHLIACAERRAAELDKLLEQLSPGEVVAAPAAGDTADLLEDAEIPLDFLEVFVEEAEEITGELTRLMETWAPDPQVNEALRNIRRHFHTFKGNGRAVGANVLGELGWAAQDMLDRVMEGELAPDNEVQELIKQVVAELPGLVASYRTADDFDAVNTRQLTSRCFALAQTAGSGQGAESSQLEQAPREPTMLVTQAPAGGPVGQ